MAEAGNDFFQITENKGERVRLEAIAGDGERIMIDGRWMTEEEAIAADQPVCTREEFEALQKQVADIHTFIEGLASALNSPMVKAMLPPNMRGMLGG